MSAHTEGRLWCNECHQVRTHDNRPFADVWLNGDDAQANARRLVACWNACIGFETGTLESCGPDGVAELAGRMRVEGLSELISALRIISLNSLQAINTDSDDIAEWKAEVEAAMKVADEALAKHVVPE